VSLRLRLHLGPALALLAAMTLPAGAGAVTGPGAHAFPITTIGSPSSATLTFAAQTTPSEAVQSVSLIGAQSGLFQVTSDQCGGQAVAATCDVTVAFAPASVGQAAATLRVVGDAGTQDVALTATGSVTGARLVVSPAAVAFGDVFSLTSTTRALTVSNAGDVPVGIDGVGVTGPQAAAFAIEADGCGGQTVAPGGGCSLVVRFGPGAAGPRSAQLHLTLAGAPGVDIALSGNLLAPRALSVMFPPEQPWTTFRLTNVSGRHKQIRFRLRTSLSAHVRLTVTRKGRVIGRLERDVLLGSRGFRMRRVKTGRYVVKARGQRMGAIRTAQASVTVTK
jgi:hypothetical protein